MRAVPISHDVKSITTVDVAALPAPDRFAFWNEVICAQYAPSENQTTIPTRQFSAKMSRRDLGSVGISRIASDPLVSRRDAQSLRRNPLDHFFLSYLTEGQGRLSQDGRDTIQRAGEFLLYDSARPFCYDMISAYSGIWLRLPRRLVLSRLGNAEAMTARSIASGSRLGALAATMLVETSQLDITNGSTAAVRVANSLMDILAAAFETATGNDVQGLARHANQLDKAKEYIVANLEDPSLNCDSLVTTLGFSRRTLNRLFAHEGTTPTRWMWQKRLERSHEMLESGAERRVTDVALNCGFSDFSHFSRAFRSEFGVTPKSLVSSRN